ncbi:705_t:CDS:1 [Ambispora gerdemannii]|uniref:Phosphatidylglycerol/phosphatidylinositol transfer protein n=1 Tax=Ambispora gerdemannii TaxID=144530 RepID=A0A9N9B5S4_9GLOM|nr:705_t:CDS:1 [Ambispora gerdemannii]
MNRNFVFALILLAMLSRINAIPHQLHKRTTEFDACSNLPPETPVLDVTISPDPVVPESTDTFTISGTLKQDITDDFKLYIVFTDEHGNIISNDILDICKEVACPIKAGTLYQTTQDVYVPTLRGTSYIVVGIANGTESSDDVLACSVATA